MDNKENLNIWERVEKTPADLIKKIDAGDGTQLNTVPSINRIKKATKIFGVYGEKWGLKKLEHKEQRLFDKMVIATLDAVFFYEINNVKHEFEITNSLPIVSLQDNKMQVNYTYRKAIETDTITKALSRLGFNADIYTDGELVGTASQEDEIAEMEFVEVGVDLKKENKNED